MPTPVLTPSQNATTFNQSGKKGWYSRLLYSFVFQDEYKPGTVDATSNLFHVLNPDYSKGTYVLPDNYWINNAGRHLRIRGNFLYSGNNSYLDIRAGIRDESGTYNWIRQNGGYSHNFARTLDRIKVPVSFEVNITYTYGDITPADNFKITGYYQYEFEDYRTGGNNQIDKNTLIPIYDPNAKFGMDLTKKTEIQFQILTNNVIPMWVTVEELG